MTQHTIALQDHRMPRLYTGGSHSLYLHLYG